MIPSFRQLTRPGRPFATRVFLLSFLPVCLLLIVSFGLVQVLVTERVKDNLRTSLRDTHSFLGRLRSTYELHNSRLLTVVVENPSLKAGFDLLRTEPGNPAARKTVDDQLSEMATTLGFDLILVTSPDGGVQAGIARIQNQLRAALPVKLPVEGLGLVEMAGMTYSVNTIPVNMGPENLGSLVIGRVFDFSTINTPAVLIRNGRVVKSNLAGVSPADVERGLSTCPAELECELNLRSETFLSLPLVEIALGDGYRLRSLQSVDAAGRPLQIVLRRVFAFTAAAVLAAMVLLSAWSSKSVVRPLTSLVDQLRLGEGTGTLPEFRASSSTREIEELTAAFNHAAISIRDAHERLRTAHLQFIESMASALDARDDYTAGHSRRVSHYSHAIALAMRLSYGERETIRVGALLHDIGKIGIPDAILLKPGGLTKEEFALVREHPTIGKRILEGIKALHPCLNIVELHHENHDGTGYPWGLSDTQIPIDARIVHLADAYDAMTSDRPYKRGMNHEEAVEAVRAGAGTQFDPEVAAAFLSLNNDQLLPRFETTPLARLAQAVREGPRATVEQTDSAELAVGEGGRG